MFQKEEQAVSAPIETIVVPAHQRKKKLTHDEWMSNLPVDEIRHDENEPICEKYGSEMEEIGEEKVYDELVYIPGKFYVRRHIAKKYKCKECGMNPEKSTEPCHIRFAEYPKPIIPHSFCSSEILAHIIYEKIAKAVPLHRQEKDFKSKGIPLLKATMSNWLNIAAEKWCMTIVQEMHRMLIEGEIIHADETRIQVLHEEGRKATTESRMWVYCNGKYNDKSIIIFDYHPTRKGEHAAKFLKGYNGYLICDGYDGTIAGFDSKHCSRTLRR